MASPVASIVSLSRSCSVNPFSTSKPIATSGSRFKIFATLLSTLIRNMMSLKPLRLYFCRSYCFFKNCSYSLTSYSILSINFFGLTLYSSAIFPIASSSYAKSDGPFIGTAYSLYIYSMNWIFLRISSDLILMSL